MFKVKRTLADLMSDLEEVSTPSDFEPKKNPGMHAFDNAIRCPICTDILNNPLVNTCGCLHCSKCINSHWTNKNARNSQNHKYSSHSQNEICPSCQQPFDITLSIPVRKLGTALKIYIKDARDEIEEAIDEQSSDSDDEEGDTDSKASSSKSSLSYCQDDDDDDVQFVGSSKNSKEVVSTYRKKLKRPALDTLKLPKLKEIMEEHGLTSSRSYQAKTDLAAMREDVNQYIIIHNSKMDGLANASELIMTDEQYKEFAKAAVKERVKQRNAEIKEQKEPRISTKHKEDKDQSNMKDTEGLRKLLKTNMKTMKNKFQQEQSLASLSSLTSSSSSSSSSSQPRNASIDSRWVSIWSEKVQKHFYYHAAFQIGQWERPAAFPSPPLMVTDTYTQTDSAIQIISPRIANMDVSSSSSSSSSSKLVSSSISSSASSSILSSVGSVSSPSYPSNRPEVINVDKDDRNDMKDTKQSSSSSSSTSNSNSKVSQKKRPRENQKSTSNTTSQGKQPRQSRQSRQSKKRKSGGQTSIFATAASTSAVPGMSRYEACPLCNDKFLVTEIQSHVRKAHPEMN